MYWNSEVCAQSRLENPEGGVGAGKGGAGIIVHWD